MNKIISLVEKVFSAKKEHGADSKEFKAAQKAVFTLIYKEYDFGSHDSILVESSEILPAGIFINLHKNKINPGGSSEAEHCCGFVLAKSGLAK